MFLLDLKLDPVDGSPLQQYLPDLVRRCRDPNAERIIQINVTVFDAAHGALKSASLLVVNKRIPFPSTGERRRFRQRFADALGSERNRAAHARLPCASVPTGGSYPT